MLRSQLDAVQPEEIVIVRTGWSQHFGTPGYADHPYLDSGIARAILSHGASVVGVDCFSPDATDVAAASLVPQPFHSVLLGGDGLIIENLAHLEKVRTGMLFIGMPLPLAAGDGSPIRAVAVECQRS